MISSMKLNLWVSLADEVPAWVSTKRNRISVDRTVRWLDEFIKLTLVSVVFLYFLWRTDGYLNFKPTSLFETHHTKQSVGLSHISCGRGW